MSHAFVEVRSAEIASAILRGESSDSKSQRGDISGTKGRGSVLGRGRRARGVTITRSSQEELMAAVSFSSFFSTSALLTVYRSSAFPLLER